MEFEFWVYYHCGTDEVDNSEADKGNFMREGCAGAIYLSFRILSRSLVNFSKSARKSNQALQQHSVKQLWKYLWGL